MKIRKIEPRDFATVAALENENWSLDSTPHVMNSSAEKIIEKILNGMGYFLAINEQTDEIIGVLDFGPRHKSEFGAHVITFGVMTVKNSRNNGIATALINYFTEYVRTENYQKITINVMSSNPVAIKLYEKLGFRCEGNLENEFYINDKYIDDLIYTYYL